MMKKSLFFSVDINVTNFMQLGMSFGTSKNKTTKIGNNASYDYIKCNKAIMKFDGFLEPTEEFIKEVKDATNTKDLQKLKQIIERYGQFIPTTIILSERAYSNNLEKIIGLSTESSKEITLGAKIMKTLDSKAKYTAISSVGNQKLIILNVQK